MTFEGGQVRDAIYLSGESPWPISAEEWEARAAETLEPGPFDYIAGGAGSESTMRANLAAFERRQLRPRMLTGNSERDLSVDVLGTRSPAPFLLAPIGVLSIAHAEGELAVARAAAATGVPMVLSSAASHSIEEVAEVMGDAPRWFQLYWVNDRDVTLSLVERAEAAGYAAIVVTLDTLTLGWRPRDLRRAYLPFVTGEGCAQFFSDPVFRSKLERPPEEDMLAAAVTMLGTFGNLALTWDDLDVAPRPDRAAAAGEGRAHGGGRRSRRASAASTGSSSPTTAGGRWTERWRRSTRLVEVREAVGPDAVVLMDGGIRNGADVLKALALGADCGAARPAVRLRARRRRPGRCRNGDQAPDGGDRPDAGAGRRTARGGPRLVMDRGVVLSELDRFGVEEIDLDEPGPGEARVRIEATGVCHSDLHVVRTGHGHPLPVLLGHEGAGVVEAVGDGVEHVAPGDRVVIGWRSPCGECAWCLRGARHLCRTPPIAAGRMHARDGRDLMGVFRAGTFATRSVLHGASLVRLPVELPAEQACLLGCAVATGVCSVLKTAEVWEGARVGRDRLRSGRACA